MTRGRETNIAYIYERATEQEYGLDQLQGAHVMGRPNSDHAGRLLRAIIANHDQPVTDMTSLPKHPAPQCHNASAGKTKSGKQTRKASPGLRPRHKSAAAATVGTTVATTGSRRTNARLAPPEFSAARTCVRSFLTGIEGVDGLKVLPCPGWARPPSPG
jgi:hypothetical protein